jgi:YHS domain-containing protein
MAKDPICGMTVDEKKAKLKSDYNGKTYYFCAPGCKATFDKNPAKYAGAATAHDGGCGCGHHH